MSRRMDREGMYRMQPQGIINRRFWDDPRCKEDGRGWVQPFTNQQGWEEFNRAVYALRCVMLFKRIGLPRGERRPVFTADGRVDRGELHRFTDEARIESDMRTFHFSMARSAKCDRPSLPL